MSLPPRLPRRRDRATRFELRKNELLEQIEKGIPDAEESYRDFLIEKGRYFYSLEEVLPEEQIERLPLDFVVVSDDGTKKRMDYANALLRSTPPSYVPQGGKERVQEFLTTRKCMMAEDSVADTDSEGHSTNAKKKLWNVDIFARPLDTTKGSGIAHLVPDASNDANEWYDVACWAMGINPENVDWATVMRLLHGTEGNDKKRVFGSGLRHFVANKARISDQERVLDEDDPQLLILPVRTRQQCLDWNGEEYEAIVLVGADKEGKGQTWATKTIGLTDIDNIEVFDASETDLKIALLLLKEFLLALVQSLVNYDIPQIPPTATEETMKRMYAAKELRTDRRKLFIAAAEKELLPVPKVGNTGPTEKHRAICKIRFSNDDSTLHPTPDPMLLAAQAAVV